MPPSSTSSNKPLKLPASIRRTKGPANVDDSECPICHEDVTADAPTLTHDSCGRRFDQECLQEWIKSNTSPTCPICRGDLVDIWDLDQHDRFHKVVDALHDIPGLPSSFHVRRTASQAVGVLHAAAPDMRREEVEKLVSDAIELAMDAIDFSGQGLYIGHHYPLGCAHNIYEGRDTLYKLDPLSVRHLWTGHRVLGQHMWFLFRLPAIPDVALWLPVSAGLQIFATTAEEFWEMLLPLQDPRQRVLEGSKEILSLPLSTDFLCDGILPINEVRGDRSEARRFRELAAEDGITHWCLADLRDTILLTEGPSIFAIPWPKGEVDRGFKTQDYYGLPHKKTIETGGWAPEIEAPLLKRFVAQHALMQDHAAYLLSSSDEGSCREEADQCKQLLEKTYGIATDEDLRLFEDEKWSTSAGLRSNVEVASGSSYGDDSDKAGDDEESDESSEESDGRGL